MDLEWPPDILIPERMITVIIGPPVVVIRGLDHCSGMIRRYPFLYVCSNYSEILSHLHRTTSGFSVRRGFTSDQVSTIISECDATYLFIEHDPSLYEEDTRLIPGVVNRIRAFAREEGTVIVYSGRTDRFMRHLMRAAHRVYLYKDWVKVVRLHELRTRQGISGQAAKRGGQQADLGVYAPASEKEKAAGDDLMIPDNETPWNVRVIPPLPNRPPGHSCMDSCSNGREPV